jgi:hypothetical protein
MKEKNIMKHLLAFDCMNKLFFTKKSEMSYVFMERKIKNTM